MVKRLSKIGVKEGRETIFIETIGCARGREFKNDVRMYANGLLNSYGGVIYFGVDSSGVVKGKIISRKEEDDLRLAIDQVFKGMQPFVSAQHYRLTFLPLDNCNYCIIELKVSIGELGEIYEDGKLKVYIVDSAKLIGPLHPQELKELILFKYKQSIEGAEEAAKYCTPNLMRTKTLSRISKKPNTMAIIPELPSAEKKSSQEKERLPFGKMNRDLPKLSQASFLGTKSPLTVSQSLGARSPSIISQNSSLEVKSRVKVSQTLKTNLSSSKTSLKNVSSRLLPRHRQKPRNKMSNNRNRKYTRPN